MREYRPGLDGRYRSRNRLGAIADRYCRARAPSVRGCPDWRPFNHRPRAGEIPELQAGTALRKVLDERPHADTGGSIRNPSQQPMWIDVETAQLHLLDTVLVHEPDQCLDLFRRIADPRKGEQVDRHLSARPRHRVGALGDLLEA